MPNKLSQSKRLNDQGILCFSEIVDAVGNSFCLPAIQRGVVWSKEDIAGFFDSLYKGFPVGSLLLWQLTTDDDRKITDYYPINTNEDKLSSEVQQIFGYDFILTSVSLYLWLFTFYTLVDMKSILFCFALDSIIHLIICRPLLEVRVGRAKKIQALTRKFMTVCNSKGQKMIRMLYLDFSQMDVL